mgnify:CR=1 FL=1
MTTDITLMKGNEAIAHAAIRYGVDGYFGYPITPQSEILETLMAQMPWQTTGMVVLQAETGIHWITERRPLLLLQTKKKTGKNFLRLSLLSLMNINIRGDSFCARMSKL